jgi:hypothetical protein
MAPFVVLCINQETPALDMAVSFLTDVKAPLHKMSWSSRAASWDACTGIGANAFVSKQREARFPILDLNRATLSEPIHM